MTKRANFLPFSFRTTEDRIRLFSLLHTMRWGNYPIPETAGILLTTASDEDLGTYVQEIETLCGRRGERVGPELRSHMAGALDTLAYFHAITCREPKTNCLGDQIGHFLDDLTA